MLIHARKSEMHEHENGLEDLCQKAWSISRELHGNLLTVHVPGMFVVNGRRGRYRAVSITGDRCELDCEHCKGTLLKTMSHSPDADSLIRFGYDAVARGDIGMLVTGGCDRSGRLPWKEFLPAIRHLKERTALTITVHAGQVDEKTALDLKESGVDQALVDVMGNDSTARQVYHLPDGIAAIRRTLDALTRAGVEVVPHILFGIHFGREVGERAALRILGDYPLRKYVIVVLMPARGTPMGSVEPPIPERVAEFICHARMELPHVRASLGCARPRGRYRLDVLAVKAGVNALALPSDQALEEAEQRGLTILHREACCSLDG